MPLAVVGDEARRLEPGVEAVPVDLGLDPGEDLVPDVAPSSPCRHGLGCDVWTFAPRNLVVTAVYASVTAETREKRPLHGLRHAETSITTAFQGRQRRKPWLFHIFFHSCGKLRGETLRPLAGRRLVAYDSDAIAQPIDAAP